MQVLRCSEKGKKNTSNGHDGKLPHIEFGRYLLPKHHENNHWVRNSSVEKDLDVTLRFSVTWQCCEAKGKGAILWCPTISMARLGYHI